MRLDLDEDLQLQKELEGLAAETVRVSEATAQYAQELQMHQKLYAMHAVPAKPLEASLPRDGSIEAAETLAAMQQELNEFRQKLADHAAEQKAQQAQYDAQREKDARKQLVHSWAMSIVSAVIGAAASLLFTYFFGF